MPTESPEKLDDNKLLALELPLTSIPTVVFIQQAPSSIQDKNKLVPKAPKTPNQTKGFSEFDERMVDLDFADGELKTLNAILRLINRPSAAITGIVSKDIPVAIDHLAIVSWT
jgi:hypothetical protein